MKQPRIKVFRNFGLGLAGQLVSQSLSFFIIVYIARVLGPSDYGSISLAVAIMSYFNMLARFGLDTIGIREVASVRNNSQETANTMFSLRFYLALITYLLLGLYGCFFSANTQLFYLLILYGLSIISTSLFMDWFFIGMEDMQALAVAKILGTFFSCVFIFYMVNDVTDIYYIPLGYFVGSVIASAYLLLLYRKGRALQLRFNIGRFHDLMRAATPFAITGVLSQVYGNLDMIMLGYMVGSEEVGYYSVAYKIVFLLLSVITVYSQSTFPVMIRLYETNKQSAGAFFKQNVQSMLYFMIPIATGGTILANNIIEVFFGKTFAPAATAFILLLYYVFFMALSITLANTLLSVKADKAYLTTLLLGAGVNVIANLVLIPYWQANGSAAAMVIAELVIFFYLASKVTALRTETWVDFRFLFIALGSNCLMALCIYWLQQAAQLHVVAIVFVGALVYIGTSWPFCAKYLRRALAV